MRFILILLLISACSTTVNHGLVIKDSDVSIIVPNLTRREDVRTILGEPSFIWNEKWHYVSTKKKYRAFLLPKIEKHDVYTIVFNGDVVQDIKHLTESDIQSTQIGKHKIKTQKPDLSKIFK